MCVYAFSHVEREKIGVGGLYTVLLTDESGWWTGKRSNGDEGFFPGSYVEKI